MDGETNQVKTMMEDALLKLANAVIEELNSGNRKSRRELLVKEATNATVTGVQDAGKCGDLFIL